MPHLTSLPVRSGIRRRPALVNIPRPENKDHHLSVPLQSQYGKREISPPFVIPTYQAIIIDGMEGWKASEPIVGGVGPWWMFFFHSNFQGLLGFSTSTQSHCFSLSGFRYKSYKSHSGRHGGRRSVGSNEMKMFCLSMRANKAARGIHTQRPGPEACFTVVLLFSYQTEIVLENFLFNVDFFVLLACCHYNCFLLAKRRGSFTDSIPDVFALVSCIQVSTSFEIKFHQNQHGKTMDLSFIESNRLSGKFSNKIIPSSQFIDLHSFVFFSPKINYKLSAHLLVNSLACTQLENNSFAPIKNLIYTCSYTICCRMPKNSTEIKFSLTYCFVAYFVRLKNLFP